eukprot:gene5041-5534_t
MLSPGDIERYLACIGVEDRPQPTLEALRHLQLSHIQNIPFENLNIHISRPIIVHDLEVIKRKVFDEKRGGYCFELNQLFYHLLLSLGYQVTTHVARVRWLREEGDHTGLTHMMLLVQLEGKTWLVDVGSGGIGCPVPLDIHNYDVIPTPYSDHRIVPLNQHEYQQEIYDKQQDLWRPCYQFNTTWQSNVADWVMGSFYTACHPESFFSFKIVLAIYSKEYERVSLTNTEFLRRNASGVVEKRVIEKKEEFESLLRDVFKLPLDQLKNLHVPDALWEQTQQQQE